MEVAGNIARTVVQAPRHQPYATAPQLVTGTMDNVGRQWHEQRDAVGDSTDNVNREVRQRWEYTSNAVDVTNLVAAEGLRRPAVEQLEVNYNGLAISISDGLEGSTAATGEFSF